MRSRSLTPQVSTALFQRGQEFYLIAVNDGNEVKVAEVILDGGFTATPCWQVHNPVSDQSWTVDLRQSNRLVFSLPRKDGVILHLRGA